MNEFNGKEKQIIDLLLYGRNFSEIAEELKISKDEVKLLVHGIYKEYGVYNRIQLAMKLYL